MDADKSTRCTRAANRIADLVYFGNKEARAVAPTITWAEIIGREMGWVTEEEQLTDFIDGISSIIDTALERGGRAAPGGRFDNGNQDVL